MTHVQSTSVITGMRMDFTTFDLHFTDHGQSISSDALCVTPLCVSERFPYMYRSLIATTLPVCHLKVPSCDQEHGVDLVRPRRPRGLRGSLFVAGRPPGQGVWRFARCADI